MQEKRKRRNINEERSNIFLYCFILVMVSVKLCRMQFSWISCGISNLYAMLSCYLSSKYIMYRKLLSLCLNLLSPKSHNLYFFLVYLYKVHLNCILDSGCYFQVGNSLKLGMPIPTAFRTALGTWASWVERNINTNRTRVFFRTFEPSHWRYIFYFDYMILCL